MIIDCHGHVSPPAELWAYKASILSHRGEHGRRINEITDAEILHYANKVEMGGAGRAPLLLRPQPHADRLRGGDPGLALGPDPR